MGMIVKDHEYTQWYFNKFLILFATSVIVYYSLSYFHWVFFYRMFKLIKQSPQLSVWVKYPDTKIKLFIHWYTTNGEVIGGRAREVCSSLSPCGASHVAFRCPQRLHFVWSEPDLKIRPGSGYKTARNCPLQNGALQATQACRAHGMSAEVSGTVECFLSLTMRLTVISAQHFTWF